MRCYVRNHEPTCALVAPEKGTERSKDATIRYIDTNTHIKKAGTRCALVRFDHDDAFPRCLRFGLGVMHGARLSRPSCASSASDRGTHLWHLCLRWCCGCMRLAIGEGYLVNGPYLVSVSCLMFVVDSSRG